MLKLFWGDWADGRLEPKPYLIGMVVTVAAFLGLAVAFGLAAGIVQIFFGSWSEHYQAGESRGLEITAFIAFLVAMIAIGLAQLNLVVKRGRDTGLPGLWIGLAYLALLGFGGALVLAVVLIFVPTGQFAKSV